jgi:hypothetical protein
MKHLIQILFLSIILIGCKSYDDQKISLKSTTEINLFYPEIEIGLIGKEALVYEVEVSCMKTLIDTFSLKSNDSLEYAKLKFDFSKLKNQLPIFAYSIITNPVIELKITALNKEHNIKIDTTIKYTVKIPPISHTIFVNGKNFDPNLMIEEYKHESELKKQLINPNSKYVRKAAILTELILKKKLSISNYRGLDTPVLAKNETVSIKVTTDTVYSHSVIVCFPAPGNTEYSGVNVVNSIKSDLLKTYENLKSDWNGKVVNNCFELEYEFVPYNTGLNGLYLVNIDDNGNFFYNEIGTFIYDDKPPKFYNSTYYNFNGDETYEGVVCLRVEKFFGYNPYTVPFVGSVNGDVKEVYLNGSRLSFNKGEDLYFKRVLHLDNGYNRVSIRIIDKNGNSSTDYMEINLESLSRTEINIDNEIIEDDD